MPLADEDCHCGRPLHYTDPAARKMIEKIIETVGSRYIKVVYKRRAWKVDRHYVALHGLQAHQLPDLGFEEVPVDA